MKTVMIHGNQYETVASRLTRFLENEPLKSIETTVLECSADQVLVRAEIWERDPEKGDPYILGTGHAQEKPDSSQINRTSALENAETSAIGRALACIGYGGTDEYASADEVIQAVAQQKTLSGNITDKQLGLIEAKKNILQSSDPEKYATFKKQYAARYGTTPLKQLTKQQASDLIETLQ